MLGMDFPKTVTAYVSTKGRYLTTLPACLLSIVNQELLPDKLVIWQDDPEAFDMRASSVYRNIFALLDSKKIEWEVKFGEGKGQVLNHQKMLDACTTEYIWRVDDDNYVEPNVLKTLKFWILPTEVGAVASAVIDPTYNDNKYTSGIIEQIDFADNVQWKKGTENISVDHLYSSFLYKKKAGKHGYNKNLSPVGHREETLFTYEMKRNGWKLLVVPSVITWHLRESTGGIRTYQDKQLWEHDENIFKSEIERLGVTLPILVNMDCGIGDHWAFKSILEEMIVMKEVIVASAHPKVFEDIDDPNLKIISIAEAYTKFGKDKMDKLNIYRWCDEHNWQESIVKAMQQMYL